VPLKKCESIDIRKHFLDYLNAKHSPGLLARLFGAEKAPNFTPAVNLFHTSREDVCNPSISDEFFDKLSQYCCLVSFAESRFPIDEKGPIRTCLTWHGAFSPSYKTGMYRLLKFKLG